MPCPCRVDCPGTDSPFANLTSEAPDQLIFIGYSWGNNLPQLGWNFGDPVNNPAWCDSTVSQQDAQLCADITQTGCLVGDCGPGGSGPSIPWSDPSRQKIDTFLNAAAFCTVFCQDGLPFTYTVKAGLFRAFSQVRADEIAISYACQQANINSVCFGGPLASTCVGSNYLAVISVSGGFAPYTIVRISGSLPPGVGFVQDTGTTAFLSGVPTTAGSYTFTVRAVDTRGNFMQKDFTVNVLGFNDPATITPATVSTAYTYQFNPTGGPSPLTVTYVSGVIPAGMTLSSGGLLSGTPTTAESDNFTIKVADSAGNVCQQNFTITVNSIPCNASTNWVASPGTCRLRIQGYVDGMFTVCANADAPTGLVWDGTFSVLTFPFFSQYNADPSFGSVSGKKLVTAGGNNTHIVYTGVNWVLQVTGSVNGGVPAGMYIAEKFGSTNPLGVYTFQSGCGVGPATVTVEAIP